MTAAPGAITGGCLCGAVRFRSSQAPLAVRACWCRVCQYLAAGNASINLMLPTDGMEITGEIRDHVSTADSGSVMRRSFCPACGTPLFSRSDRRPHAVVVRAGALDDPEIARPSATIWTASAPSWGWVDRSQPCTEGQPAVAPGAPPEGAR